MRLGTRSPNDYIQYLNTKNEKIQKFFLQNIKKFTQPITVKVMLGDSTITEQKTFDPQTVQKYFEKIINNLKDWTIQEVSFSNNEDLRRVFTKFEIKEDNYLISGHFSLQYHVLLYYKPIQRVIDAQKELARIIDLTKNKEQKFAENNDELVLQKLKEKGYKDLNHQKLFEIFFENNELREEIFKEIEESSGENFQQMLQQKNELIKELDNLLIETYQTSQVLIDDSKLVTGEEGCLCTFDIEFVRDGIREGIFDPKKISESTKKKIEGRLENILDILKE